MEVLGAIGSSIAIAQALAAGPKIISFVREIPEIQNDFNELCRKLDVIESISKEAQRILVHSPSIAGSSQPEVTLISKAATQVKELLEELDQVLRGCIRESGESGNKKWGAKKRKWLLESGKIQKLRQKAQAAIQDLHFAMSCHDSRSASQQLARVSEDQAEMRQLLVTFLRTHPTVPTTFETGRLIELPATSTVEKDQDQEKEPRLANLDVLETRNERNRGNPKPNGGGSVVVQQESWIHLRTQVPHPWQSCSQSCLCRCHFSESSYNSWNWVRPVLGSWLFRCDNVPYHRRPECTEPRCRRKDSTQLRVEYRVPKWLALGLQHFVLSYSSQGGLTCSLRPARRISETDSIWSYLSRPLEYAQRAILNGPRFYPDDYGFDGMTPVEYAIVFDQLSMVEFLLNLWGNIILEQGLPRAILYVTNSKLAALTPRTDYEYYIWQKVKSLVHDAPGHVATEIHESLHRGAGLEEALREQPWAIDMLDDYGYTPLFIACRLDKTRDVQQLIAAQANVNEKGWGSLTPLMGAAFYSSLDCATLLLKAGCHFNMKDEAGRTALHWAAQRDSPEMVSLLLAAGASAVARDSSGATPLHYLAGSSDASPCVLRKIIDLLLLANPAAIGATDDRGLTPALRVFNSSSTSYVSKLQALREAGASFLAVTDNSWTLLHFAAGCGRLDMLTYLIEQEISGIDTEPRGSLSGDSAWDIFQFSIHASESVLLALDRHRPTPAEQEAFARLYQGIRDRNLSHEIDCLGQVFDALRRQQSEEARQVLAPLIKQKEEWKRGGLVDWYRAVDKRIQHAEWELAREDLEGYIEELRDELDTSVWDIPSRHEDLWDSEGDETDVTESVAADDES